MAGHQGDVVVLPPHPLGARLQGLLQDEQQASEMNVEAFTEGFVSMLQLWGFVLLLCAAWAHGKRLMK